MFRRRRQGITLEHFDCELRGLVSGDGLLDEVSQHRRLDLVLNLAALEVTPQERCGSAQAVAIEDGVVILGGHDGQGRRMACVPLVVPMRPGRYGIASPPPPKAECGVA